jgi:ketosteroid isomerase-like protein
VDDDNKAELRALAHDWDQAMLRNVAGEIGGYMAPEWVIIGTDGSVGDKATFLSLVESGALTHDVMETDDMDIRVYGDTAVTISRGVSGGQFQGQPFHFVERVTCVFVRRGGWQCVLTHLSALTP